MNLSYLLAAELYTKKNILSNGFSAQKNTYYYIIICI